MNTSRDLSRINDRKAKSRKSLIKTKGGSHVILLGVTIDKNLILNDHINNICCFEHFLLLHLSTSILNFRPGEASFNAIKKSHFNYAPIICYVVLKSSPGSFKGAIIRH